MNFLTVSGLLGGVAGRDDDESADSAFLPPTVEVLFLIVCDAGEESSWSDWSDWFGRFSESTPGILDFYLEVEYDQRSACDNHVIIYMHTYTYVHTEKYNTSVWSMCPT